MAITFASITPNHGSAAGGIDVVITGSGFSAADYVVVTFLAAPKDLQESLAVIDSDTQLTVGLPYGYIGAIADLEIKAYDASWNLIDSVAAPAAFQYDTAVFNAPNITAGPVAEGTPFQITGTDIGFPGFSYSFQFFSDNGGTNFVGSVKPSIPPLAVIDSSTVTSETDSISYSGPMALRLQISPGEGTPVFDEMIHLIPIQNTLFMDGFDADYQNSLVPKWLSQNGSNTLLPTSGRRGGGCLSLSGDARSPAFGLDSQMGLGFALKLESPGQTFKVTFWQGEGIGLYFSLDAVTGRLGAYDPATDELLSENLQPLTLNAWDYVGLYADSVTGQWLIEVNGIGEAGLATVLSDTAPFDAFSIEGVALMDDLYSIIGSDVSLLGNCRVDALALDADSTPQEWTPDTGNAWERLNQDAGSISADTVGQVSNFSVSDLTHSPSAIYGIQVTGYADSEGTRSVALQINSTQGQDAALSTQVSALREASLANPDTSAEWTAGEVDALEVGAVVTL